MGEYISSSYTEKLDNRIIDITYEDIKELFYKNERDRRECEEVTKDSYAGNSYYSENPSNFRLELYREVLYRDPKTSGFMMQYPHGLIIRQGERNNYYRGENQIYPKTISTLARKLYQFDNEEDRQLYKFIADMRVAEFGMFLFQFDYVQRWATSYGDVLFDVLAQHYGLETSWLDITNDFNVALFFATCYYDQIENKWRPLTKDMTDGSEDTKHGMIFHIPQWQVNSRNMQYMAIQDSEESAKKFLINNILPIGFQPFMRCHMQHGYGIKMVDEYPLQEDFTFEKLRFRHSEKLSNDIYEIMGKGKLIYPHEGLLDLIDIIENISQASVFTEEAFDYAFENSDYFMGKDKYKKLLAKTTILGNKRIIIGDTHPYTLSRQRKRNLDRKYKEFSIEEEYGIRLMARKARYGG